MTDQHPITPPQELVQQWIEEGPPLDQPHHVARFIADRSAQWGADQELEACVEWVSQWAPRWPVGGTEDELRIARRPKPLSLKGQALAALSDMSIEPCVINGVDTNVSVRAKYDIIRRALEQLDD